MKKRNMHRRRRKRWARRLLFLLVVALLAVIALIAFKQHEYGVSADYYGGLRNLGMLPGGGGVG